MAHNSSHLHGNVSFLQAFSLPLPLPLPLLLLAALGLLLGVLVRRINHVTLEAKQAAHIYRLPAATATAHSNINSSKVLINI